MSISESAGSQHVPADTAARCPIDHSTLSHQKMTRSAAISNQPIECDAQGIWQVRGFEEARVILRSSDTKQAGFNAELLERVSSSMTNTPILYQEGKVHNQQRKQAARFFTPKTVSTNYRRLIETLSDQLVDELKRKQHVDLSRLSLKLAVRVAAEVVGLTNSRLPGMSRRLDAFFQNSEGSGYWKPLARLLQLVNQGNIFTFYMLDVKPAIRARKRRAQEDVISHLLGLGYSDSEILTECVTYAAAGMVTTREFISIAAWHFLEQPALRERYLAAPEEERFEMLHEVLRLEPIVGNLYRRATADIRLDSQGAQIVIPQEALINIHVHAANVDESVVGEEPLALCPGRVLRGEHVPSMVMGFGDGHHRCPGSFLAIQETDIFLRRLLALDTLHIERAPTINWNELVTGYEVRNFFITLV